MSKRNCPNVPCNADLNGRQVIGYGLGASEVTPRIATTSKVNNRRGGARCRNLVGGPQGLLPHAV